MATIYAAPIHRHGASTVRATVRCVAESTEGLRCGLARIGDKHLHVVEHPDGYWHRSKMPHALLPKAEP